jgi:hypothetical protein
MCATKALTFGLAALMAIPSVSALKGFDTCTSLSYTDFESSRIPGTYPHLGPKGIYATSKTGGECIYVDASSNGDFAREHPDLHTALLQIVGNGDKVPLSHLDFVTGHVAARITARDGGARAALEELQGKRAICNDVCNSSIGSVKTCDSCSCQYSDTDCVTPGLGGGIPWCISYWRCQ